jgi:hypothetical protein
MLEAIVVAMMIVPRNLNCLELEFADAVLGRSPKGNL